MEFVFYTFNYSSTSTLEDSTTNKVDSTVSNRFFVFPSFPPCPNFLCLLKLLPPAFRENNNEYNVDDHHHHHSHGHDGHDDDHHRHDHFGIGDNGENREKIAGRYILFLGSNGSSTNHIFYS